eukprot:2748209-Pyramimonas_sp.AAC.1
MPAQASHASHSPLSLQALAMATHQVEVLFVLCTLLGGKQKTRVQDALGRLGLVDVLAYMFDFMDWTRPAPPPPDPHGVHGPACSCNPESALKIQFLRLVHNFCDRDSNNADNKRLLLSGSELSRFQPCTSAAAANKPNSPLPRHGRTWDDYQLQQSAANNRSASGADSDFFADVVSTSAGKCPDLSTYSAWLNTASRFGSDRVDDFYDKSQWWQPQHHCCPYPSSERSAGEERCAPRVPTLQSPKAAAPTTERCCKGS